MAKGTPGKRPGTSCGQCGRSKTDQPEQFRIRRRNGREGLNHACKPCEADQRRDKRAEREGAGILCEVPGCERPAWARNWCTGHYARWQSTGDPGEAEFRRRGDGTEVCKFEGCERPHLSKGYCTGHYQQSNKGQPLRSIRVSIDPLARNELDQKRCTRCLEWLSVESFHGRNASHDSLHVWCKRCAKDADLSRHFGISLSQYEQMVEAQGGGCAVCGRGEGANGRMLAVDHDHACCPGRTTCGGCVRGLLCVRCNLHFGAIGDSLDHVEAMATYLRAAHARMR